jgi:hypothetical protein
MKRVLSVIVRKNRKLGLIDGDRVKASNCISRQDYCNEEPHDLGHYCDGGASIEPTNPPARVPRVAEGLLSRFQLFVRKWGKLPARNCSQRSPVHDSKPNVRDVPIAKILCASIAAATNQSPERQ